MNRRAVAWMVHIVSVSLIAFALAASANVASADANVRTFEASPVTVDSTVPSEPPTSANDFFPDDADVTDCLGTIERPGCGSKARGGWRQTLVFVAMFIGLFIIFGRVALSVRRGRENSGQPPTLAE